MSNTNLDEFSPEELIRVIHRDRFVKEQQAARIGSLITENLELLGIVQEQQRDLQTLRESQAVVGNGPTPAPTSVVS